MEPESSSPSVSHRRSTPRPAMAPPMSTRPAMAIGPQMPQRPPSYLAALMQGKDTAMLPSQPATAVHPTSGSPEEMPSPGVGRRPPLPLPSRLATAVHPTSGWSVVPTPGVRGQPHPLEDRRPPPPPTSPGWQVVSLPRPFEPVSMAPTSGSKPWGPGGRLLERQPTLPVAGRNTEEEQDESWIAGSIASHAASPSMSNRPLPYRCPPFPKGGSPTDWLEWNKECRRIYKLAANDPFTYPPTLRETKDSGTISAVTSSRDKAAVHRVAQSIVSVSSIGPEGVPIKELTGIVIGAFESSERARILTSSEAVCDGRGKLLLHKLRVRLPNKAVKVGELVFFDPYYDLALLEISADMPLQGPSFVSSSPKYGEEVFVLTRNGSSALMARKGSVLWHEESYKDRNFYLYLSCEPPECGTGGLVVNQDGDVSGVAFDHGRPNTAVLPSCIIKKWVEMRRNFSCIARPIHGLCLRGIEFLDVQWQDDIFCDHGINSGYLVVKVAINSTAEALGIRNGDLIVSFNGMHSETLPQLESYLLSLGWKFLERNDPTSMVVIKLQVYNPHERRTSEIRLPVGFSTFTGR